MSRERVAGGAGASRGGAARAGSLATGLAVALALAVLGAAGWWLLRSGGEGPERLEATLNLAEAMGGADTAGYARALEPRPFVFPEDHGPHPDFRTEWWYVTANLETAEGRRFGVQFTLFRSALAPPGAGSAGDAGEAEAERGDGERRPPPDGEGSWSTRQVYMGHLAVSDPARERFVEAERFTRASAGLAGGQPSPLRVWMDDWSLEGGGRSSTAAPSAGAVFPLELRAGEAATDTRPAVDVRLALEPEKPLVLQGDRGLSQKGREPGNASFYYSFTRLAARGTVSVDGEPFSVTGTAWLDREWSTSALSDDQAGWDWFALQLRDGRDLMVYRLRRTDGSTDPLSEGVLVAPDGSARRLSHDDFSLEETASWTSPLDGARYPSGWIVRVPAESLELAVEPVQEDQELNVTVRYWEGAVDVSGSAEGRGYVELTGYGGSGEGGAPGRAASSRFKPGNE